LFVAVAVDAALLDAAQALAGDLRLRASSLAPRARITWVPAERMHVTIRFIGQVDDPGVERVTAALAPAVPQSPFEITLGGTGVFPDRGAPRVLWVGVRAGVEELRRVERTVNERLADLGIRPEDEGFSPHLTLARVRDAAGLRARTWLSSLESAPVGTTRVDAITLYESRLSPKGPTYVPLQRSPLIAA
jgi:2'-5' RNA ligase